jgi:hypothetical protein
MAALTIPPSSLEDLGIIREIRPDRLRELGQILQEHPPILTVEELEAIISEFVPSGKARSVARQLLALCTLRRDTRVTVEQLLQRLTEGLEAVSAKEMRWTAKQFEQWRKILPSLHVLLASENVETASKALDLAFEYANLLRSALIVTDIRPVYNFDGSDIRAAVVSQTLRIYFDTEEMSQSLSIAIDEQDIVRLKESCEKALRKAHTAKQLLQERLGLRATITGEDNGESE